MTTRHTPGAGALKIVVVDDDRDAAALTAAALEQEAFEVTVCHDAESGVERARGLPADLVLLDLSSPGMDGIEVCRRLRTFSDAYVIMLTGQDTETDRLIGLSVGADDLMGRPYSHRELVARVRALQRRPRSAVRATARRRFGALEIDPGTREVTISGRAVDLSRTEYELLDVLSAEPHLTLARRQLLQRIWGDSYFGDDHVIDVHISNLRRKLGDDPSRHRYVVTVRGYGYRVGAG